MPMARVCKAVALGLYLPHVRRACLEWLCKHARVCSMFYAAHANEDLWVLGIFLAVERSFLKCRQLAAWRQSLGQVICPAHDGVNTGKTFCVGKV